MADEQSRRIGELLSSGQLTCQVILLRAASPGTLGQPEGICATFAPPVRDGSHG